jgi:hypothetical protein
VDRGCAGVQVEVSATRPVALDLGRDPESTTATTRAAVPDDALFLPLRGGWLVSFPGSRSLSELLPGEDGYRITVVR